MNEWIIIIIIIIIIIVIIIIIGHYLVGVFMNL